MVTVGIEARTKRCRKARGVEAVVSVPLERLENLDGELTRAARSGGALRLYLGLELKALEALDGHREMGFPSIEAYALERCGRGVRWVQESRKLARALENLPLIQCALIAGRIGWSMAALIARHASAEDEPLWAEEAERRPLRTMRWLIFGPRAPFLEDSEDEVGSEALGDAPLDGPRTLTVTVDREDAWLYECARMVVGRISGQHVTHDDVLTALLAEGGTTLQDDGIPAEVEAALQREEDAACAYEMAERAWKTQLAHWREAAEERCERRLCVGAASGTARDAAEGAGAARHATEATGAEKWQFDGSIQDIDAQIRQIADELATRDLLIGRLAAAFWKADGWRGLGYASAEHYARERLVARVH